MPAGYTEEEARRRQEQEDQRRGEQRRNREVFQNYNVGRTDEASDVDQTLADIPLVGWLTGASDRVGAAKDAAEADRNRQYWERVAETAPTEADLTPDYYQEARGDEYGDLLMGDSRLEGMDQGRQEVALGALRGIMRGSGYTAADRAQMAAARQAQAQELGARNAATRAQMQARGMGGSGAALAAQMSGNEAMAGASAMGDAAIQQAAMQRYLGATQNYGALSSTMQGQEMARRQALDSYNQANMDWRRGREQRNTGWANRGEDKRSEAAQTAYQNRERTAAGLTNQYSTDVGNRNQDANRDAQRDQSLLAGVGTLLDL